MPRHSRSFRKMVREGGVEPPHHKAPDPKSGASTNSATLAIAHHAAQHP